MGDAEPVPGSARRQHASEQPISGLGWHCCVGIQAGKAQEGSGRTGVGGSETSYGCAGPRAASGPVAVPGVMGCMGSLEKNSIGSGWGGRGWCPPRFGERAAHLGASSRGLCVMPEQLWDGGHYPGAWTHCGMRGRVSWGCTGFILGCSGRNQRWGKGWIQVIWGGTSMGK